MICWTADFIESGEQSGRVRQAWPATSEIAFTGVVIIGHPHAMASARGRPNPSRLLGQIKAIAF